MGLFTIKLLMFPNVMGIGYQIVIIHYVLLLRYPIIALFFYICLKEAPVWRSDSDMIRFYMTFIVGRQCVEISQLFYRKPYNYKGKLFVESDGDKVKSEEVLLNIITDEPDEVLKNGVGGLLSVFLARKLFCPSDLHGHVFHIIKSF